MTERQDQRSASVAVDRLGIKLGLESGDGGFGALMTQVSPRWSPRPSRPLISTGGGRLECVVSGPSG